MKNRVHIIGLLLLFITSATVHAGWFDSSKPAPEWFTMPPAGTKGYEYYGTGMGTDDKEAQGNARAAIATAIRSDIDSGFFSKEEIINESYSQEKRRVLNVKTDISLTDAEIVKQQQVGKTWYVLMKYENLTIGKKCKKWLHSSGCAGEKQNSYLARTRLIREINAETGCTPDMRLVRKDKTWYLTHNRIEKLLPLTSDDVANLLIPYQSDKIMLTPSNTELREGAVFSFTVQARQDGFVTLFDVYENGEVFVVEPNQPVKANQKITIPDAKSENEMVAGLLTPGKPSTDLYVVVYSNNQGDFSSLQRLGQQLAKDEDHFKFDELLRILDQHDFSATVVKTMPK